MDDTSSDSLTASGVLRGVAIIVLLLLLVGFGLCGAFGTVAGLVDGMQRGWSGPHSWAMFTLQCGLLGLAIAAVAGWGLFAMLRRRRKPANRLPER